MAGPLDAQTIAMICDHMNDDHADAVAGYARTFGGCPDARTARLVTFDASGMDIAVDSATGPRSVRIAFDHELRDGDDARDTLIAMAKA
jgi:putative heme iron utilization protein